MRVRDERQSSVANDGVTDIVFGIDRLRGLLRHHESTGYVDGEYVPLLNADHTDTLSCFVLNKHDPCVLMMMHHAAEEYKYDPRNPKVMSGERRLPTLGGGGEGKS